MKRKLVYGVGINDADYQTEIRKAENGKEYLVWFCPYFKRWNRMLERCYSDNYHKKFPTYIGCYVCEEWLTFSNFKRWMESQDWEDKHLDKDFLVEGNKVYSPSTCMFIPAKVNIFLTSCNSKRGNLPIGVSPIITKDGKVYKSPYRSSINNPIKGKNEKLGCFTNKMAAHMAYLKRKKYFCEWYIEKYREDVILVEGLSRVKDKIQYHIENNLELTSF